MLIGYIATAFSEISYCTFNNVVEDLASTEVFTSVRILLSCLVVVMVILSNAIPHPSSTN